MPSQLLLALGLVVGLAGSLANDIAGTDSALLAVQLPLWILAGVLLVAAVVRRGDRSRRTPTSMRGTASSA
jgi:hypothetical protein